MAASVPGAHSAEAAAQSTNAASAGARVNSRRQTWKAGEGVGGESGASVSPGRGRSNGRRQRRASVAESRSATVASCRQVGPPFEGRGSPGTNGASSASGQRTPTIRRGCFANVRAKRNMLGRVCERASGGAGDFRSVKFRATLLVVQRRAPGGRGRRGFGVGGGGGDGGRGVRGGSAGGRGGGGGGPARARS